MGRRGPESRRIYDRMQAAEPDRQRQRQILDEETQKGTVSPHVIRYFGRKFHLRGKGVGGPEVGSGKKGRKIKQALRRGATLREAAEEANATYGFASQIAGQEGLDFKHASKAQRLTDKLRGKPEQEQRTTLRRARLGGRTRYKVAHALGIGLGEKKPGPKPGSGVLEERLKEQFKDPHITIKQAAAAAGSSEAYAYEVYHDVYGVWSPKKRELKEQKDQT